MNESERTAAIQTVRKVLDHACWPPGTPNPHAALEALAADLEAAEKRLEGGYKTTEYNFARAEAAETALAQAHMLLWRVVQADRDDAKMGYPLPGDSCLAACIGLEVMRWLDERVSSGLPEKEES